MGPDELDLTTLQADLEQVTADMNRVASLFSLPEGDVTETDDLDLVTVVVSPDLAVRSVTVDARWGEEVSPDDLTVRVNTTLSRATVRAMGFDPDAAVPDDPGADVPQERATVTEADKAAAARLLQATEAAMDATIRQAAQSPDSVGAEIEEMLDRVEAQLRAAEAATVRADDEAGEEPARLYSENRMVSAAVVAGTVSDIEINANWLRGKSGTAVTQCLAEILQQVPPPEPRPTLRPFLG